MGNKIKIFSMGTPKKDIIFQVLSFDEEYLRFLKVLFCCLETTPLTDLFVITVFFE